MKNKIITLTTIFAMVIAMFTTAIMATSTSEVNTADAMNELGLFRGVSEADGIFGTDTPKKISNILGISISRNTFEVKICEEAIIINWSGDCV